LVNTIGILRACQLGLIGPSTLMTAIMNYGQGIDVAECMVRVRETLPSFKQL
jgi:hypothetical protein